MSKQRMIVSDDQLLVDMEFIFNAIREEKGDWQKVEQEMKEYREILLMSTAILGSPSSLSRSRSLAQTGR